MDAPSAKCDHRFDVRSHRVSDHHERLRRNAELIEYTGIACRVLLGHDLDALEHAQAIALWFGGNVDPRAKNPLEFGVGVAIVALALPQRVVAVKTHPFDHGVIHVAIRQDCGATRHPQRDRWGMQRNPGVDRLPGNLRSCAALHRICLSAIVLIRVAHCLR